MFANILHQAFLIVRVVDRKAAVIADVIDETSQDADACGVEGTYPDAFCAIGDDLVHPLPHFIGRFVCERQRQDLVRVDLMFFDQIGDAVGQHPGFSGTSSRQN